jgi:hypothetical protein
MLGVHPVNGTCLASSRGYAALLGGPQTTPTRAPTSRKLPHLQRLLRRIITSIITCDEALSSPPFLLCGQSRKEGAP